MRVVLDPNVIVSALVSRGTTAAVWRQWLEDDAYTPIVCPMLLAELEGEEGGGDLRGSQSDLHTITAEQTGPVREAIAALRQMTR